METTNGNETLQVLREVIQSRHRGILAYTIYNLLAQVPEQREELIQSMAEVLGVQAVSPSITEEECLDDLPAFLDMDSQEGVVAAARAYPHVWWHLWQSPECADIYLASHNLFQATHEGALAEPPRLLPVSPPSRKPLIQLCREFLNSMLPLPSHSQVMGMAMASGTDVDDVVLVDNEETEDGYQLSLSVRELSQEHWDMMVKVSPLPQGNLVVTMGQEEFRANFDTHGSALVSGIPSSLLMSSDVPGLMIAVEPSDGSTYPLL